jgi:alkylation response protein AidB-like acyl-CoA dehydrogenase
MVDMGFAKPQLVEGFSVGFRPDHQVLYGFHYCTQSGVILYCHPLHHFGTDEQKQKRLVPFAKGEKGITALIVERGTPGFNAGTEKLGITQRHVPSCRLLIAKPEPRNNSRFFGCI